MENKQNFQSSQPSAIEQISHELRTPLTGILGMAHFLAKTPLSSEQKEYLEDIVTSARHLLGLENKLLVLLQSAQDNA